MLDTINIVAGALSQALETMAFMEVTSLEEDAVVPESLIMTQMTFDGPESGHLQLMAGRAFAEELAVNIGALDEATEADCGDALKELANVTCGLITPVIASDMSDVFDLTIPCIVQGDDVPPWHEFVSDEAACELNVEGHMLAAKLTVQKQKEEV